MSLAGSATDPRLTRHRLGATFTLMNQSDHDDACRCMACGAERFKRLNPDAFGKAPPSKER